jgi:hypothetical protein
MRFTALFLLVVSAAAASNTCSADGECERTFVAIKPDGVQRGLVGTLLR